MSNIFNVNPDPDYPVLTGPGFIQHTCQPYNVQPQYQQQFYYNGQSLYPQQQPNPMDSRRYDAPPQPIQSGTPTYAFNQLVEATRRTDTTQPNTQNPWAQQPVQPVQQQQMVQPVPFQQMPAPVDPNYYQSGCCDPRYSAIYTCHPSFDKKQGVWGDQEVYNPILPPTVNWGAAPVVPTNVPQYGYIQSQPMMPYPQIQQPVQQNWRYDTISQTRTRHQCIEVA